MRLPALATALITSNDGDVAALECCLISTHARKYRCRLQGGAHGNGIDTLLRSRHVVTQRKCLRRRLRWRFSFNSVSIFFLFSSHFFSGLARCLQSHFLTSGEPLAAVTGGVKAQNPRGVNSAHRN